MRPRWLTTAGAVAQDEAAARQPRTWPALLVLFFLPGITAEILSGSTPPLVYLTNSATIFFNVLLYGSGAILIREVARRRGLGWPSILLLGAAYGIFEEGLVVNTWANPWLAQICAVRHGTASGICDYSRVGGINLTWAVALTVFHAVVSIAIPILLVELLFPRRASYVWLGRKAPAALVLAEAVVLAFGLALNIASFRQHHQAGPPLGPYLFEAALMALCIALALRLQPQTRAAVGGTAVTGEIGRDGQAGIWPVATGVGAGGARASGDTGATDAAPFSHSGSSGRAAPRLWTLRMFGFVALSADILLLFVLKGLAVPYGIALAAYAALLTLAAWRVHVWSRRAGWSDQHRLALASGALGFLLIVWDPILEVSGARGTLLVALAYFIMLVVLARRLAQRGARAPRRPALVSSHASSAV